MAFNSFLVSRRRGKFRENNKIANYFSTKIDQNTKYLNIIPCPCGVGKKKLDLNICQVIRQRARCYVFDRTETNMDTLAVMPRIL